MEAPSSERSGVVMMSVEHRAWILFGLVLLLGAAAGLAWHLFSSARYTTFEIRTADPVSGLIADSPVEFHGVEVGKVLRVRLVDARSVSILVSIRRDAPVTRATVATITARGLATRGFTGYVYVALEASGIDQRRLAALPGASYPLIPAAASQSATLDTNISEVKQDVQQLTDLLHTVLDQKSVAALKGSVDNLQKVTAVLAANSRRLDALISSAAQTTMNAERLSRDVKPLLDSSQQVVRALQNQILPETDDAIAKISDLSTSLKEISTEIERNPALLVRGRSPPTPGPGERK
jgi:phospholipid/cholesterol/gamma-HCH transport system substrate-binding protein